MSIKDSEVRSKLALLQLATELGSITRACEIMGYSRDSFYRFKRQYEAVGERGLKNLSRKKPVLKNRMSSAIEEQVIEIALDYPNYGQAKVAELLCARGSIVSASGVRTIWLRHNLETKKNRLLALHTQLQQQQLSTVGEQQIENLHKISPDNPEFECLYPGDICIQDTIDLGVIEPVGQLYQHTLVDGYSQYAHALVSTHHDALAAIAFLQQHVLPWYHHNQMQINTILTDRGSEFSGKKGNAFKIFLQKTEISHIQMRAYNGPVVNGLGARFQTIALNDFYGPYLKHNKVESVEQLNNALQEWCQHYNHHYSLLGRYTLGKTAFEVLQRAKKPS